MTSYRSIPDMFEARVAESPHEIAYRYPVGDRGGWEELTWRQTRDRVRRIASGLLALGIEPEERCAILSSTRLEWILADLGVLCAGGATTTIYPSNTPAECAFIINDSDTQVVFAEDDDQVAKLAEVRDQLPGLRQVITIDGQAGHDGWVITADELEERGDELLRKTPDAYDERVQSVQPDQLATLIYTSGTTGRPKGVELVHDCWVFEGETIAALGVLTRNDHQYLWLPLSHSFGKVLEAAQLHIGFATTIDGRIPKLVENLAVVKPTFMAAAPRIFEKVYNKVVAGARDAGGLKYRIFTWALDVGGRVSQLRQRGKDPGLLLALQHRLADRLVFSKLKARFGGRLRCFISGSAPLSRDIAEFFHAADILILEGYGLTESSAASFCNRLDDYRFGTVGQKLPGVEVKLDDDGEILLGGRGIMRGYHNLPDATAEVLENGWLRTGDIGDLDERGFLRITDRKKDLIKTSGGKYVAPQKLEGKLKALCPYISQVLVHGNERNFVTALVTLDEESIQGWAADNDLGAASLGDLAAHPRVQAMVAEAVAELNRELASYETIKKFELLPLDFSVESGELTPSLKVRRKVVEGRFKGVLDAFYKEAMTRMS